MNTEIDRAILAVLVLLSGITLVGYPSMDNICPEGMAYISEGGFCIFKYEASRSDANRTHEGTSQIAASQKSVVPWTKVTWNEAKRACEAAGYKLATNSQWQAATEAVEGEPESHVHGNNNLGHHENTDQTCENDPTHNSENSGSNSNGGRCLTGTGPESWETSNGVADLNGNVWEWTSTVYGKGSECDLNESGYIASWNSTLDCPNAVSSEGNSTFDNDYYWRPQRENSGHTVRGGAYQYQDAAGPYAIDLRDPPSNTLDYLGFRCSYEPATWKHKIGRFGSKILFFTQ